jgi:hypothetical protein
MESGGKTGHGERRRMNKKRLAISDSSLILLPFTAVRSG